MGYLLIAAIWAVIADFKFKSFPVGILFVAVCILIFFFFPKPLIELNAWGDRIRFRRESRRAISACIAGDLDACLRANDLTKNLSGHLMNEYSPEITEILGQAPRITQVLYAIQFRETNRARVLLDSKPITSAELEQVVSYIHSLKESHAEERVLREDYIQPIIDLLKEKNIHIEADAQKNVVIN